MDYKLFKVEYRSQIDHELDRTFPLFLLIVHLAGNLQLLFDDGGEAFNVYAYIMTHNPLIKVISWGTYFFIILHAVQGILIALSNKVAKASKYAVSTNENASWASKNMMWLGILVLSFMFLHMGDFWFKMKAKGFGLGDGWIEYVNYDAINEPVANLYDKVVLSFSQLWVVIFYLFGLTGLALHLNHGFGSAFQTLGLNHKKYTPFINGFGKFFSFVIPLLFAIIPIYIYFTK